METVGYHALIDFIGVKKDSLKEKYLMNKLKEIFDKNNVNVELSVGKPFKPHGDTIVFVLSSSHCTVHTWPEYKLLSLDLYMCSDEETSKKVIKEVYDAFEAKEKRMKFFERPLR